MMNKNVAIKGLILIVIAIILGAFVTHGLEGILSPDKIDSFRVGVHYQLVGGMLLLIFGINFYSFNFPIYLQTQLLFIGICLFSFSIYLLNLLTAGTLRNIMGPITPIGGLLMIISIILIIWRLCKSKD